MTWSTIVTPAPWKEKTVKCCGSLSLSLYHVSLCQSLGNSFFDTKSLTLSLLYFWSVFKRNLCTSRGISFFRFCQLSLMISFRPINDGSKRQLFFLSSLWLSMQVFRDVQKVLHVSFSQGNSFAELEERKKWSQETSGKERPKEDWRSSELINWVFLALKENQGIKNKF